MISSNINKEVALAEEIDRLKSENFNQSKALRENENLKQQKLILEKHLQEGYQAN